jgi:predicted DNA-binding transcriptional regulator AlpA
MRIIANGATAMHPRDHEAKDTGARLIDPRAFGLTRMAYSVNETLAILSIGRTSLYQLVNRRELKPAKLGKKTLFYAADIAAFLTRLKEAA